MKIAIITFHCVLNYGAVLQAYALSTFLKKEGHEPIFIQYGPNVDLQGKVKCRFKLLGLHPADYIQAYRKRTFAAFRKKYLQETDQFFTGYDELDSLDSFDAYICGSDQIWNAELTGGKLDAAFFLHFAKGSGPKIAYAASMGQKAFDDPDRAKSLLEQLTHISVREKAMVDPIAELSEKSVISVVDPTLLLDDYTEITTPIRKKYILLYALQTSKTIYAKAKIISKITGLPIINLGSRLNPFKHPGKQICGTPEQFVSLFKHAEFVVTNSFHGTVFSTMFKKRFICCALEGARASRNVRMHDFLTEVGLIRHLHYPTDIMDHDVLTQLDEVDWTGVEQKLACVRSRSVHFLRESLKWHNG